MFMREIWDKFTEFTFLKLFEKFDDIISFSFNHMTK